MPVIRAGQARTDSPTMAHPVLGSFTAQLISDTGGLTQFGAFTETLPPGSRSSFCHWHAQEDEFILVLVGEITLYEGGTQTVLHPGDAACFPAGNPVGHYLENQSNSDITYLVVGTRAPSDTITYPDQNRVTRFDRTKDTRSYTTLDGAPATSPYDDPV